MKILLVVLLMSISEISLAYDAVFYCTYQNDKCVQEPVKMSSAEVTKLIRDVAKSHKNYIGFTDSSNVTIQFYVDGVDKIWLEIPMPDEKGSYGKHITSDEMFSLVESLETPYINYKEKLSLIFRAW